MTDDQLDADTAAQAKRDAEIRADERRKVWREAAACIEQKAEIERLRDTIDVMENEGYCTKVIAERDQALALLRDIREQLRHGMYNCMACGPGYKCRGCLNDEEILSRIAELLRESDT